MIRKIATYFVTFNDKELKTAEAFEALLKQEKISANAKLKAMITAELEREK